MTVALQARSPARRLDGVTMEGAFTVADGVRASRARGLDVLDLSIGEPGFPTPPHIVTAAVEALHCGETRYTPPAGLALLREAVAQAHAAATGAACTAANVVVTPGAKPALLYALLALLDAGDEVLVPDPGFPAYRSIAGIAGAVPVGYDCRHTVDAWRDRITARTRVIVLNSPHNPTGSSLDRGSFDTIARIAIEHDLWIVSDEVYARLWYGEGDRAPSCASADAVADRLIVVDGFSKSHSMTGWRLGHAIAPVRVANAITRLAVNAHSCVAPFVQRAGIAALAGPDPVPGFVRALRARRDLLVAGLNRIPGIRCAVPDGAFFVLAHFEGIDDIAFTGDLLDRHGVAAVPGSAFSPTLRHHVRFSFAPPEAVIVAALDSIAACTDSFRRFA